VSSASSTLAASQPHEAALARKKTLRQAFGAFATGVTVVTARDARGRPVGFTANSFTSVSLDPPLLLVCPGKTSSSFATFSTTSHFAVNILASDQQEVSHRFATPVSDRFAGLAWHEGLAGLPLIDGAAATFTCARHQLVDAGDHVILIGEVLENSATGAEPLVFSQGRYRELASHVPEVGVRVGVIALHEGRVLLRKTGEGAWELPLGPVLPLFGQARNCCEADLAKAGAAVTITHPYSIYDDGEKGESRFFFMAELEPLAALPSDMELFAPDELPIDLIRDPGMRDLLFRHGRERQKGRYGVYVAHDRASGSVSHMTGGSERWPDIFQPDSFLTEGMPNDQIHARGAGGQPPADLCGRRIPDLAGSADCLFRPRDRRGMVLDCRCDRGRGKCSG